MQSWNDEALRVKIIFDNGLTYTSFTHTSGNNQVVSLAKISQEQTNYNNLFGSITGSSVVIRLFDLNDNLNIENTHSPYYGYMRIGAKVEVSISYDDQTTWKDYGTYYVTSWSGVFNNGMQDITEIQASDELQYILNADMPKLASYAGVRADDLIRNVLTGIGINKSRIKINSSLNINLLFGVSEDAKVGYFLNDICQALCAVIIINDSNDILVEPALTGYSREYVLDSKYIESVSTVVNNKNIYSKVRCRYNKIKGNRFGYLLTDSSSYDQGAVDINNEHFARKALSVKEIAIEDADIDIKRFSAYQNGTDLDMFSNSDYENVDISITGDYMTEIEKYADSEIKYTDNKIAVSYEMFNEYIQTEKEAQAIADLMAKYIEVMNTKIDLITLYTPSITTGDVLVINDAELKLCGKYKVIGCKTVFGTTYGKNLTIIPYSTFAVWDDSKSWDDNISWLENLRLSQN